MCCRTVQLPKWHHDKMCIVPEKQNDAHKTNEINRSINYFLFCIHLWLRGARGGREGQNVAFKPQAGSNYFRPKELNGKKEAAHEDYSTFRNSTNG